MTRRVITSIASVPSTIPVSGLRVPNKRRTARVEDKMPIQSPQPRRTAQPLEQHMDRERDLDDLERSLTRLVALLRLDPTSMWQRHFEASLEKLRELRHAGYSQSDLNNLSASIMHVYGGMWSFNDYSPACFDKCSGRYTTIPGTEDFRSLSSQVYDQALALRVVGMLWQSA
jgi:hypothetical protein